MAGGILLDTHTWLWYAGAGEGVLGESIRAEIEHARRRHQLFVSSISVWEVGMLSAKGRISLSMPLHAWVKAALDAPGLKLLPLDAETALESTQLPGEPHGDPADRFLMASARVHALRLATTDRKILDYAGHGHIHVLRV